MLWHSYLLADDCPTAGRSRSRAGEPVPPGRATPSATAAPDTLDHEVLEKYALNLFKR